MSQVELLNDKQLIDKLIEKRIEPKSVAHPAFIMNHPMILSPLAKSHAQGRRQGSNFLSERFELFINGMEVVNSYSE
jgi:lysyl-tRNA synthetase class 2